MDKMAETDSIDEHVAYLIETSISGFVFFFHRLRVRQETLTCLVLFSVRYLFLQFERRAPSRPFSTVCAREMRVTVRRAPITVSRAPITLMVKYGSGDGGVGGDEACSLFLFSHDDGFLSHTGHWPLSSVPGPQ